MPRAPYAWVEEPGTPALSPGAVLVTGFPSAGLAAIVASHYMVRVLNLPRIGQLDSSEALPIAVIQGGHVNPPIRGYGRPNFALVVSEFPPTPSSAVPIAQAILDTAEAKRCRLVLCLEGVVPHPVEEEAEEAAESESPENVWVVLSKTDPALAASFKAAGARFLEEGVIGGVSGALLVRGLRSPVPVATLLVSTRGPDGFPDHRAAAALIELLDRLLPELEIDTKPLRTQAEVIERALRAAMRTRPKPEILEGSPESPAPSMYQ